MTIHPEKLRNILLAFAVVTTLAGVYFLTAGGRPQYGVILGVFAAMEWWMVVLLVKRNSSS